MGRPVFGVEVQCVSDTHEPLPPGAVGQLRYRGPGVASGYFGEAGGGESPFRDGWFYPGDLASLDEGGHVEARGIVDPPGDVRDGQDFRAGVVAHPRGDRYTGLRRN